MFEIKLTPEEKARADDRQRQAQEFAQEFAQEKEREEQRRRERCVELACGLEETRPENLVAVCKKIYAYVYGRKE